MATPFLGQISLFGFNFAPRGWGRCDGQILPIAQNTALFSLLGTNYGGNGQTTFALPDLRGRVAIHQGQGPGLTNRDMGEVGGQETHTLIVTEIAAHSHLIACSNQDANDSNPVNAFPAAGGAYQTASNATMNTGMGQLAGGSQPHNNMQPFLVVNFCIALEGIFPSRN
jgi:microcystin-dependent protein